MLKHSHEVEVYTLLENEMLMNVQLLGECTVRNSTA